MRQFHLQIVTPDGTVFDGDAEAILLRCGSGDVEIMAGHEDFFATVGTGRAKLTAGGKSRNASASGGFVSVRNGKVRLVSTTFEFSDEIDLKRAEAARLQAEEAIKNAKDDKALLIAKAKLRRAINRINVSKIK